VATFVTPDQFPAIRSLVQIGLGPGDIPDEVIGSPVYGGAADQFVLLMLGTYDIPMPPGGWATDPLYAAYQTVADYWCAALLAQAYPSLTSERYDDYGYTRTAPDLAARAAWLRSQAEMLLLLALGLEITALQPVAFINAPGSPRVFTGF
jgi:hypothetical protein